MAGFAHPWERAYARLLDGAGIRWLYEPHFFALERGEDGRVLRAFVPDFYLPDVDVYVECTSAKSRFRWRKNRKIKDAQRRYGVIVTLLGRSELERLLAPDRA